MGEKRFRDADGNLLCDRCHGPIVQPPTGRRRLYCGRNCREQAYRARATQRRIAEAVDSGTMTPELARTWLEANGYAPPRPDTSVDETPAAPDTSVDETEAPRMGHLGQGMTAAAMARLFSDRG